jgi:hypothetical protein
VSRGRRRGWGGRWWGEGDGRGGRKNVRGVDEAGGPRSEKVETEDGEEVEEGQDEIVGEGVLIVEDDGESEDYADEWENSPK